METIYNWLLHNTGNEGNFYTILNTQRNGTDNLEIMARTADFTVVNLHIHNTPRTNPADTSGEGQSEGYVFGDEQQVVNFLAEGKTPEWQTPDTKNGIRVMITEPTGQAGDVTFPSAQA